MLILSSLVIGAAVAQDAFAVSALYGTRDRSRRFFPVIITSAVFAIFQMIMPILGWSVGKAGSRLFAEYDHILAFLILVIIGTKMMIDSKKGVEYDPAHKGAAILSLPFMAFATSIDALTVGITLPTTADVHSFGTLMLSVTIIGAVTFMITASGYLLGRKFSGIHPAIAQVTGGAVLVIMGIKALLSG